MEHPVYRPRCGCRRYTFYGRYIFKIIPHCKIRIVSEILRKISQKLPVVAAHLKNIVPAARYFPRRGLEQRAYHPHHSSFSCSIDSKQSINSVLHIKTDIINSSDASKLFCQPFKSQFHISLPLLIPRIVYLPNAVASDHRLPDNIDEIRHRKRAYARPYRP